VVGQAVLAFIFDTFMPEVWSYLSNVQQIVFPSSWFQFFSL